jgi:hypothetical protein
MKARHADLGALRRLPRSVRQRDLHQRDFWHWDAERVGITTECGIDVGHHDPDVSGRWQIPGTLYADDWGEGPQTDDQGQTAG